MKYLILSFYIVLNVFVSPLFGTTPTQNEVHPSDRDGAKKSLLFVEFQMNPYDPLAKATDKVWNRVFQPIFKRLESIKKSTAVPSTFSSSTLASQPSQATPSTGTVTPVTPVSPVPPNPSFSAISTQATPFTSTSTTPNDASTIISTTSNTILDMTVADTSVSMNFTSAAPSTTQLLNCIDWLLEWLQKGNSSVPLRSKGRKDEDAGGRIAGD